MDGTFDLNPSATIAQKAYLNDLYNRLDVPHADRVNLRNVSITEASVLISALKTKIGQGALIDSNKEGQDELI